MSDELVNLMSNSMYSYDAKIKLMHKLVYRAEEFDDYGHIINCDPINSFYCTLCQKLMNCPYNVVEHVRGVGHKKRLENKKKLLLMKRGKLSAETEYRYMWDLIEEVDGPQSVNIEVVSPDEIHCGMCHLWLQSYLDVAIHVQGGDHQLRMAQHKQLMLLENSSGLGYQNKIKLMWEIVRETDGKMWQHISQMSDAQFFCDLCEKTMSCPYNVVQHVWGRIHRHALEVKVKFYRLKNKELNPDEECQVMWELVAEAEGKYTDYINYDTTHKEFFCQLCDKSMFRCFNVVEHARGRVHQYKLRYGGDTSPDVPAPTCHVHVDVQRKYDDEEDGYDDDCDITDCGSDTDTEEEYNHNYINNYDFI